jgi:hypothetical protein
MEYFCFRLYNLLDFQPFCLGCYVFFLECSELYGFYLYRNVICITPIILETPANFFFIIIDALIIIIYRFSFCLLFFFLYNSFHFKLLICEQRF